MRCTNDGDRTIPDRGDSRADEAGPLSRGLASRPRPQAFHVMCKPTGPVCNLDCTYCFYLNKKQELYPGATHFRMSDDVLEQYIRQYIDGQKVPEVTFGWQGGEPTLLGIEFFRKALFYQDRYRRPGLRIVNTIQTNGTLLDETWCRFLRENDFLVGLSLDGPRALHDRYRVDRGGNPSFDRVMHALSLLHEHQVELNVLCVVNRLNAQHPEEVYRFFKSAGVRFIQFIPAVERLDREGTSLHGIGADAHDPSATAPGCPEVLLADHAVRADQYGDFLCSVFEDWVRHDVGRFYVQIFDVALQAWLGVPPSLCLFAPTCGNALAMEHNGDLFSCDHYVYPSYLLGNIMTREMRLLVQGEFQGRFGAAKRDTLPRFCRECEVRFVCNGGCPKDRFGRTPEGESGLNYLCAGYRRFFRNIAGPMRFMASELRAGRPATRVMAWMEQQDAPARNSPKRPGRNAPCPCGSGRKYKHCCGV